MFFALKKNTGVMPGFHWGRREQNITSLSVSLMMIFIHLWKLLVGGIWSSEKTRDEHTNLRAAIEIRKDFRY